MRMTGNFLAVTLLASSIVLSIRAQADSLAKTSFQSDDLIVEDLRLGTGADAVRGAKVVVNYKIASNHNGGRTVFPSKAIPFQFVIGSGVVLSLWNEGLLGMKVGGTRRITAPSNKVYPLDPVEANDKLKETVYEVSLLALKNVSIAKNPKAFPN
jgi:FKBP-type peptidyl-prolyl cis-trans isomerase